MQAVQHLKPAGPPANFQGCSFCLAHKAGWCATAMGNSNPRRTPVNHAVETSSRTMRDRQMIYDSREFSEYVIFICDGKAVSSVALPDGRRQIIEILLPGDMVFWTALLEPVPNRIIEAVEETTYRSLKRTEFRKLLFKLPDLFNMFIRLCAHEKTKSDQLALTLGRRNAQEKIARLIVNLAERLAERGLTEGQTIRFSLRLRHIADATGLTSVHVSKVLGQFQRAKIIDLEGRSLTIYNTLELQRIAGP